MLTGPSWADHLAAHLCLALKSHFNMGGNNGTSNWVRAILVGNIGWKVLVSAGQMVAFSMNGRVVWHPGAFIEILVGTTRNRMMTACQGEPWVIILEQKTCGRGVWEGECPLETDPVKSPVQRLWGGQLLYESKKSTLSLREKNEKM